MKFFLAFALIAVAAAAPSYKPAIVLDAQAQEIAQIMEAIYSPSTDPATAAALESLLLETLGVAHPISVGPAIVESHIVSPIHIGAEIVDFPVAPISVAAPVVEAPSVPHPFPTWEPVKPSPVIIGEIPAGAPAPLVQIVVNVNDQASAPVAPSPISVVSPVAPSPVSVANPVVPSPVSVANPVIPSPVSVANPVVPSPVSVANPVIPSPVSVANPVVPSPVSVVAPVAVSPVSVGSPVAVSPISVGTPVLPSPAVSLPESLN